MTLSHRIHILQGPLEFPYVKVEGSEGFSARPYIPVTFSSGKKSFRVGHTLVDTGSDLTILPLQIAHFLEIELDDSKRLTIDGAGGTLQHARIVSRLFGMHVMLDLRVLLAGVGDVLLLVLGFLHLLHKTDEAATSRATKTVVRLPTGRNKKRRRPLVVERAPRFKITAGWV